MTTHRDTEAPLIHAIHVIRDEVESRQWTQADLASAAGLTAGAISMLFAGERRANPSTLEKLTGALDMTPAEVLKEARKRAELEHLLSLPGTPFLAVGPFLDGLIFQWAAQVVIKEKYPFLTAARLQPVHVEPWHALSAQLHSPKPSFLFALTNFDLARRPPKTALSPSSLLMYQRWSLQLEPCFCAIVAQIGGRLFLSFRDRVRHAASTARDQGASEGARVELLAEVAGEIFKGRIVLVEAEGDMVQNVRALARFHNCKRDIQLKVVTETEWRQRSDWPSLAHDETVIVEGSTPSRALELLSLGLLSENVVVIGGSAQGVAALVPGHSPRLVVALDDADIKDCAPDFFDKRWQGDWYRPINRVLTNERFFEDQAVSREVAEEFLNSIFAFLQRAVLESPAMVAAEVLSEYEKYGGAGWALTSRQLLEVLYRIRLIEDTNAAHFGSVAPDRLDWSNLSAGSSW